MAGPRGFDSANKIDRIKRHKLVDTADIPIAATVTAADAQNRATFPTLVRKAKKTTPTIAHFWPNKGYTDPTVTGPPRKPGSASRSCPRRNPPAASPAAGSSNAPTAR